MNIPTYLSIIVPVHNEQARLENCIEQLMQFAECYKTEIIIVDNGSTDDTLGMANLFARIYPPVKVCRLEQRGKGLAVRTGMLAALGRYRYMCDVDLSTPASELYRFLEFARIDDVVIGSREQLGSQVSTTEKRRMIGRLFHSLVRGLVPGIKDTQCGFKMFRDYAAIKIFENATVNGMAFDVEALYLARLFGFRVYEIPVSWTHNADSRVNLFVDSLDMLWDVMRLKMQSPQLATPKRAM